MPIYDRPVKLLFRDMVKDLGMGAEDMLTREQAVGWFRDKYPKIKPATISAHLIKLSINAPSRVHYGVSSKGEDDLFYQVDSRHYRLYNKLTDPQPLYTKEHVGLPPPTREEVASLDDEPALADTSEFAYEKDLRSFLSKNLGLIEPKLRLYEEEGITGIEFPVGGRYIDILAVDKNNGYVVIELKVSRGYDRVVGQLLRYMAWIKKNLADDSQTVRGVIVAREISDDLRLAASLVPDAALYEYQMSVTLKQV